MYFVSVLVNLTPVETTVVIVESVALAPDASCLFSCSLCGFKVGPAVVVIVIVWVLIGVVRDPVRDRTGIPVVVITWVDVLSRIKAVDTVTVV